MLPLFTNYENCFNATLITFIFIVIFQLPFNTRAQYGFEKYFWKSYANNNGFGWCKTTDGGFILCGSSDNNALMIKTDQHGDEMWHQDFTDGNMECIRLVSGWRLSQQEQIIPLLLRCFSKNRQSGKRSLELSDKQRCIFHITEFQLCKCRTDILFFGKRHLSISGIYACVKVDSGSRATQWTTEINKVSNCSPERSSNDRLRYSCNVR